LARGEGRIVQEELELKLLKLDTLKKKKERTEPRFVEKERNSIYEKTTSKDFGTGSIEA